MQKKNTIISSYYILFFAFIYFAPYIAFAQRVQRPVVKQNNPKEALARKYYGEKNYKNAAELFEQIYKEKPTNNNYFYYLNSLLGIKDYKKAEQLIKHRKKINKNNYRIIIDEAYVADLLGNKRKANKIFNKLLNNLPDKKNQILQIASNLQSRGYTNIAITVFQKAEAQKNQASYDMEIANAYFYTGDYDKMFDSYIAHLEHHPEDLQRIKSRLQYVVLMDVNSNLSNMLNNKLLEASQKHPDNVQLAEMLLWHSLQIKDFDMAFRQAKSIDIRFGNLDYDILELANIAYSNNNYNISAKAYKYIKNKKNDSPYYTDAYVGYYLSLIKQTELKTNIANKGYKQLVEDGDIAIKKLGINNQTSVIIVNIANLKAYKLNNPGSAIKLLKTALNNPAINQKHKSEIKIKLADILLSTNNIWDATLLYSQVENDMKNEPIGHEAKLKNAKVYYYIGEFDWANTQLDVLKSSTSKLISNDAIELSLFINNIREEDTIGFDLRKFAKADLYTYQNKYDSALLLLNKIEADPAGMLSVEYTYYKKGLLYSKLNEYKKADSVYTILISHYPESIKTDNALFNKAIIQQDKFGNFEEAKRLYLILMTDYPESIYAGRARKKYRMIMSGNDNGGNN